MRPFDPRLLRHVPVVRAHLGLLGLLGLLGGVLIITQATAMAALLDAAADDRFNRTALLGLLSAVLLRAGQAWAIGALAAHTAATVKARLRADLLAAVGRSGPAWLSGQRAGEIATLAGRGLDALDPYFTGYLPQLVLTVTVPVLVLVRIWVADWGSAVTIAVTLPLIPVFGALLGWQAQAATERQWRRLSLLGGHFLDMVTGLATLRVFGRARAQVHTVRRMADGHRVATMRTLRIAFLSSLVLELIATISVALVAVPVGLRLVSGGMQLSAALLILLLAPEAYLPLRTAGTKFHASVEGLTALDHAFRLLSAAPAGASRTAPPEAVPPVAAPAGASHTAPPVAAPARANGTAAARPGAAPRAVPGPIRLERVSVAYERTVALDDVSLEILPGQRVAVIGPSGAGKSTLLALLLGFAAPTSGRVLVDGVELGAMDLDRWRAGVAWVPQRAHLFAASLRDNIRLGGPAGGAGSDDPALDAAVRAAHLTEVVAALPEGLDTPLGERGHGLSSGQRQRVALARAFLRDAPLLLLDEPTARLDAQSEAAVLDATRRLAEGRTAILVAHRPALLAGVDRILRVEHGRVTELGPPGRLLPGAPAAVLEAPATSVDGPAAAPDTPVTSMDTPATSVEAPATTPDGPAAAPDTPVTSMDTPAITVDTPAASVDAPATTADAPAAGRATQTGPARVH